MENKKKVIGYVRVSTEEQVKDGFSLDNQRSDIKHKCNMEDWELLKIFEDEGISGASLNERDGLKAALKFAKEEKVDYLIVWKLSRLSRKVMDVVDILKFLEHSETSLLSIKDNIDTATHMGKYFLYIASIFAEIERENIIVQVKGGMAQKAREGLWNGGSAPLGYKLVDKKLIINKEEAKIIKFIFTEYLTGKGYKAIAKDLNDRGLKTSKNAYFSGNSVKDIITNPIYAGRIRWGRLKNWGKKDDNGQRKRKYSSNEDIINVNGVHEAIIDLDIFKKAQQMLETNPRHNVKQFNGKHLLSGIIRCPDCGYGMSIQVVKSKGRTYEYYSCNQYSNKKTCKPNLIPKNAIEKEFYEVFEKIVNEDDFITRILSSLNNSNNQVIELEKAIARKEKDIKDLEKGNENLLEELREGTAAFKQAIRNSIEKALEKIEVIQAEVNSLKESIGIIKGRTLNLKDISEVLQSAGKVLKLMDNQTQRMLISKLIKEIKTEGKHIKEICFSFEDGFRVERDKQNLTISK